MKKIFLSLFLIFPTLVFADNCNNPSNDFDGLYCLNKVYIQADADLNKSYKKLKKYLSKAGRSKLRSGQKEWINERNADCSYHKNGQFFVSLRCATDTTIDRTNFLNDRIRECKATGCQTRKL